MLEIFDCEQGTPEWFEIRRGVPTASCFADIMTKSRKKGEMSKTARTYMLKLAGEILTGELTEQVSVPDMLRGHAMEPIARETYAFLNDVEPVQVGFMKNHGAGCSPDSMIGDNGMLEIKSKKPHLALEFMLSDDFPDEHKAQCQGQLWIAEREWIDLIAFWPDLPPFVKRAYRDEAYIKELADAVSAFQEALQGVVDRVEGLRAPIVPVEAPVAAPVPQTGPLPGPEIPEILKRTA